MDNTIINHVDAFLKKHHLYGKQIVCALSGGEDSVALLYVLNEFKTNNQIELSAFHVHHGIRGSMADRDLEFCKELCKKLDIPFDYVKLNVLDYAKEYALSVETAARILRYDAFNQLVLANPNLYIATAHHQKDQAETLLFRLFRGTGPQGLVGIKDIRDHYIRPFISLKKESIEEFIQSNQLDYVVDETNLDEAYKRNYIRRTILPTIVKEFPNAVEQISKLSYLEQIDDDYFNEIVNQWILSNDGNREKLQKEHLSIISRVLKIDYLKVRKSLDAFSYEQMKQVVDLLISPNPYGSIHLPMGIEFKVEKNHYYFHEVQEELHYPTQTLKLGWNNLEKRNAKIFLTFDQQFAETEKLKIVYNSFLETILFLDTMDYHFFVREKEDGDSYRFGGMTHKLKKLFNDKNISLEERKRIPILCIEEGILWVPGFPPKEQNETKNKLYVYYYSQVETKK